MTPAEYIQLKAFARIDGALLALLLTVSFISYLVGLKNSLFWMLALLMLVFTPFWLARRLRRFRDVNLHGVISLMRGWAFCILVFFYAGVLLALIHYVYFAFLDQGYLLTSFQEALSLPDMKMALQQYGLQQSMMDSIQMMNEMRPIDFALNVLTTTITAGIVLGLPLAAVMKRSVRPMV